MVNAGRSRIIDQYSALWRIVDRSTLRNVQMCGVAVLYVVSGVVRQQKLIEGIK